MNAKEQFTSAVGRLVAGDIYVPQTKDFDGKQMVVREGPDAGKPTQKFVLGLAIPKQPGQTHFSQETTMGALLWQMGHAAFPGIAQQRQDFAWKAVDGDSTVPNQKNVRPCDREGFPGHWVFFFSGKFAPKCYDGTAGVRPNEAPPALDVPGAIKRGYYVQIAGTVGGNKSASKPGLFVNPSMVCLRGYGQEIVGGADPAAAGFGAAPLPTGASAMPLAGAMPAQQPPIPGGTHAAIPPPVPAAAPAIPVPAVPSLPVVPNPSFPANAGGGAPAIPTPPTAAPPVPAAGPQYQMTGTAGPYTREQMLGANWTDAALIAAGHMRQV